VCVRRHSSAESILTTFEDRVGNDLETELATALTEIGHITRLRLEDRIGGP
jgi:2-oxo-4-hydroxy-4-carboxy-5-ureidoimidazoline decarboxylase